jgi:hypothetical protein
MREMQIVIQPEQIQKLPCPHIPGAAFRMTLSAVVMKVLL